MNVYLCRYRGMTGYCCRKHNSKWMFVPELGQVSDAVIRNVALENIDFDNTFAKTYELALENEKKLVNRIIIMFRNLLLPVSRPVTLAGKLFAQVS